MFRGTHSSRLMLRKRWSWDEAQHACKRLLHGLGMQVVDDENQAEKYRDDLNEFIHNEIEIFVIGGKVDSKIDSKYTQESIKLLSFSETVSKAMNQLNWLLGELKSRNAS